MLFLFRGGSTAFCGTGRSRWTSRETVWGCIDAGFSKKAPWAVSSRFGDLPKPAQTCLTRQGIRHDKSTGAPNTCRGAAAGEADMTIMMPASDQAVLGRRGAIVAALRAIVPGE